MSEHVVRHQASVERTGPDAPQRARRRLFLARRIAAMFALVLMFVLLNMLYYGTSSSDSGYAQSVSAVEAGTLPEPPGPLPAGMGNVWAAAVAVDSSPDLATRGKTGTSGGRISLTFDDGPDPRTTPRILATLGEHHVKATFFVVGRQVEKHPALCAGSSRKDTPSATTPTTTPTSHLTPGQMRLELHRTQKAVDEALGYHYQMMLMRPPYGEPYFKGSDALPAFRRIARQEQLFP